MTEEIIIDECFNCKKKKDIGDNWRTCKLKCSYKYKRKENDYITRLEQENKELKAYKDVNEDFKKAWDELNEKHKRYSSALEEIKAMVTSPYPGEPRDVLNIINEVLNDSRE